MTSDPDIYRAANVIMKQYGEDAPIEAAMSGDAMLARGAAARSTLLDVLEPAVALRIGVVESAIEREIDD